MTALNDAEEQKFGGSTIQFAELDQTTNEIQITDEAMSFLGSLPNDKKLAIVTVVGSIDSGKSFLANRLLGMPKSFVERVGMTDGKASATQGMRMWNEVIQVRENLSMILIDMQGLPEPTLSPTKVTSALRSPRTLRSPRQF